MHKKVILLLILSLFFITLAWSEGTQETIPRSSPTVQSIRDIEVEIPDLTDPSIKMEAAWDKTLNDFSLEEGEALSLTFPPGGKEYSIAGTGIYTSYSSIATAAVHAGLMSMKSGGEITILAIRGLNYYPSSERNAVYSHIGGKDQQSFVFLDQNRKIITVPITASWATSIGRVPSGTIVTLKLPPGGRDYFVFGSGPYDVDSAAGAAAVHAGLISFDEGGEINIEVLDSPPAIEGSSANGVVSRNSISSHRSFRFIDPDSGKK